MIRLLVGFLTLSFALLLTLLYEGNKVWNDLDLTGAPYMEVGGIVVGLLLIYSVSEV